MQKKHLLIGVWLIGTALMYYGLTEEVAPQKITVVVTRVIDGDTFETDSGLKVRLLGINTPERKQPLYSEAKSFLTSLVENQTIQLEVHESDKYGRLLAHAFKGNLHINEAILKRGLATLYYYEHDSYFNTLESAEKKAYDSNSGIWTLSPNADCIYLVSLQHQETPTRCTNTEQLILKNTCNQDIDITFKDDATHIYEATLFANTVFSQNYSCIFNDAGDSLYVWDDDGLVEFYRYP